MRLRRCQPPLPGDQRPASRVVERCVRLPHRAEGSVGICRSGRWRWVGESLRAKDDAARREPQSPVSPTVFRSRLEAAGRLRAPERCVLSLPGWLTTRTPQSAEPSRKRDAAREDHRGVIGPATHRRDRHSDGAWRGCARPESCRGARRSRVRRICLPRAVNLGDNLAGFVRLVDVCRGAA